VEVTGPLKTCCGETTFVLHKATACVVQFDTHLGVAQSRLQDVVQAETQFLKASSEPSAPAFPPTIKSKATASPADFRCIPFSPRRIHVIGCA
jgi:hypothetical protein